MERDRPRGRSKSALPDRACACHMSCPQSMPNHKLSDPRPSSTEPPYRRRLCRKPGTPLKTVFNTCFSTIIFNSNMLLVGGKHAYARRIATCWSTTELRRGLRRRTRRGLRCGLRSGRTGTSVLPLRPGFRRDKQENNGT